MKKLNYLGFSLIEMLVVISIFALLGLMVTQIIVLSLRGTRKSQASFKVRSNLDYAMSVMERQIRGARSIACEGNTLTYTDNSGTSSSFSFDSTNEQIASGSAALALTSSDVSVTSCSFTCATGEGGALDSVGISIIGEEKGNTGKEGAKVSLETQINLRNY